MKTKNWFEVSRDGLKELQAGKPKHYVARELIQNAWDEEIKVCSFDSSYSKGIATFVVKDDSPEGFRNIADAFTLFAPTIKRSNAEKRGRFNLGEKQVLAIAESAEIKTTKGTVIFNKEGRFQKREKTGAGSQILINVKMTKDEYDELLREVETYLSPKDVIFNINGIRHSWKEPYKTIRNVSLLTEIEENGALRKAFRKTSIDIYKTDKTAKLYEMGLPIVEIDCLFDVNINQKVPLSVDRDNVPASYLKSIYAEVLNSTVEDISSEQSSEVWIREATSDKRINSDAVKSIVEKRYGDRVVVANPFDKNSIDEAISNGYNVIYGNELSKDEWGNIRKADAIKSSTDLFGSGVASSTTYKPDENMLQVANLAKRIAKKFLKIDITVGFSSWDGVAAQFGLNKLDFNVKALSKDFFNPSVSERVIDLIVHEIAHSNGNHTEKSYHNTITKLAGQLTMLALKEPKFFENN
jgi:hypothetical protein